MKKIAILLVSIFIVSQSFASDMDELTDSWTRSSAAGRIDSGETDMDGGDTLLFSTPVPDSVWVLLALAGGVCLIRKRKMERTKNLL